MISLDEWLELDAASRERSARFDSAVRWIGSVEGPSNLADCLSRLGSYRQGVLFACACCRRLKPFLVNGGTELELLEEYADNREIGDEVMAALEEVRLVPDLGWPDWEQRLAARAVSAVLTPGESVHHAAFILDNPVAERRKQYRLLLDIFDQPTPPPKIDPVWLVWGDGSVRALAQTIYRDRRFDELPILGDALEDAGCTDSLLLDHCRSPGPHVRGCWVVDRLLGHS